MPHPPDTEYFLSRKRSGVLAPLFSVYSKNSFGIGDFNDLKLLCDWAKLTGNSVLQLLPMNEMGQVFCPYDALSSFALEPSYIFLPGLPFPKDRSVKRQINSLKNNFTFDKRHCDYSVKKEKLRIMREVFLMQKDFPDAFRIFKEENFYWLKDFSLFKAIKEFYHGIAWYDWPVPYRDRKRGALEDFIAGHTKEIEFEEWMQWQLFEQFREAKRHAGDKGILLKGDLPILVSRDSSDVWAHPDLFKLEFAAGAPPDMYCALGQRWGMPTYNWEKIEAQGYIYLKEKLKYAGNFYDLLRIDHVVGLFRIWGIPLSEPLESKGANGFFDPHDEHLWREHGRRILQVMQGSTDMMLCAEDLGVIPACCTDTLRELRIPGNDVQRWVKDWNVEHDFLKAEKYRFLSVAMLSTHDTTNWAAWWENEAGTVDEALFIRKCSDHRQIGFERVRDALFDPCLSRHGRLRWRKEIASADRLFSVLSPQGNIPRGHLGDFLDLWENSFDEKEKLWKILGLRGNAREKCDEQIMEAVFNFNLNSNSLFCINNIFDLLYIGGLLKGDPYENRINTPGTVDRRNWSLLVPLSLESLLEEPVNNKIREMVFCSGRQA